jgi:hypothetical protein
LFTRTNPLETARLKFAHKFCCSIFGFGFALARSFPRASALARAART